MPKKILQRNCALVNRFWQKNAFSSFDFESLLKIDLKPFARFLLICKFIANKLDKVIIDLKKSQQKFKK